MCLHSDIERKGHIFATYFDLRRAEKAIEGTNGMEIKGRIIRAAYIICPRSRQSKKDLPISSSTLAKSTDLEADLTEKAILNQTK